MLEVLTYSDFFERVGEEFRVAAGEVAVGLVLSEVTNLARKGDAGPRRAPFSLVFRGPLSPVLPQRIWPLEHAALGTLEIFLVPIGPDAEGMRYEAVFN
ncbi:MAG: hypothetical protein IPL89_03130 [Acidobacteria bacterium]|nr:hypothetical protein [Acidobacteriota bacterium]